MSELGQLRKRVHYETDIPRCASCVNYKPPRPFLRNSLPQPGQALCKEHLFTVRPNAVCDKWAGKDGASLA